MPVLETSIDRKSDDFRANAKSLQAQVAALKDLLARIAEGGGAQARERHVGRGKRVAVIQSGGNIDRALFALILAEEDPD